MLKADLHIHSLHSDGSLSVEEIIVKAKENGLSALSITDHDCIDAYPEAFEIAKKYDMRIIVGCEFSCVEEGKEFHMLGYNFDIDNTDIKIKVDSLREDRLYRAKKISEKLQSLGLDMTISEIEEFSEHGVIGRLNIAKALVAKKMADSTDDAFYRYLSDRAPAYVPKSEFKIKNAIRLIHRAGGVACLAHPDKRITNMKLYHFIKAGLDGIEVVHPYLNENRSASLKATAMQYQLIQTGGSDYHGNKEHEEIMFGSKFVAESVIDNIIKRSDKYRTP